MDFQRLFAYDDWANREEVAKLRSMASPPERALKLLAHILGASEIWLARLTGSELKVSVWPELTLDQCESELNRLRQAWKAWLPGAAAASTIKYVNTKGQAHTSRVDDVLMHVIIHGGYHRGQIASVVRGEGEVPAYTDYILCTRGGYI